MDAGTRYEGDMAGQTALSPAARIGLPDGIVACIFDLDGVLTTTADLHFAAWKETFDALLRTVEGDRFREFDKQDYAKYVDGRPRADGVRIFLESRGIHLPLGEPDDPPDAETVNGVGNRKNVLLLQIIEERGVEPYPGSVRYLNAVRAAGLKIAVVSSSANAEAVLSAAGLSDFVDVRVDGLDIVRLGIPGKPAPDSFVLGASQVGVKPADAVVFEDALAGVAAGRAGGFGFVVGVDRIGQAEALKENGADIVVKDLADLLVEQA